MEAGKKTFIVRTKAVGAPTRIKADDMYFWGGGGQNSMVIFRKKIGERKNIGTSSTSEDVAAFPLGVISSIVQEGAEEKQEARFPDADNPLDLDTDDD